MIPARQSLINWLVFIAIAIVWGSSFILMKEGLKALDPFQVASLRMVSAGLILVPAGLRHLPKLPRRKIGYILLSGLLGSFFPAFLFCIAETKLSSSYAGFLNTLTPIFTLLIGIFFFQAKFSKSRMPGVFIGFAGMIILFLAQGNSGSFNLFFSSLIVLATILYAWNVNLVSRHLRDIPSLVIVAVAFTLLFIPSLSVLISTGYFGMNLTSNELLRASSASAILGIFGTATASLLFYILLKRAGTLFSSMVTYSIPFVALFWGLLAGEPITMLHIAGLAVILIGVYTTNR